MSHGIAFSTETVPQRKKTYIWFMRLYLHQPPYLAMQVWEWKSSICHFQLNFKGFAILTSTFACADRSKAVCVRIWMAPERGFFLLESKALQKSSRFLLAEQKK